MSIFDEKKQLSRFEFRQILRKANFPIPGTGEYYSLEERVRMEKELFPPEKYGTHISERDFIEVLRELERKKYHQKSYQKQLEIDKLIRFLKKLSGIEKIW